MGGSVCDPILYLIRQLVAENCFWFDVCYPITNKMLMFSRLHLTAISSEYN